MTAPPHKRQETDLSAAEYARLKEFADAHGVTVDEAATRLAKVALDSRYRMRRLGMAKVLPLRKP